MSQADAENGLLADEFFDFLDDFRDISWVSRSIGEEDAIRLECEDIFCLGIRRHDDELAALFMQGFEDIALYAEIHGNHKRSIVFLSFDGIRL